MQKQQFTDIVWRLLVGGGCGEGSGCGGAAVAGGGGGD